MISVSETGVLESENNPTSWNTFHKSRPPLILTGPARSTLPDHSLCISQSPLQASSCYCLPSLMLSPVPCSLVCSVSCPGPTLYHYYRPAPLVSTPSFPSPSTCFLCPTLSTVSLFLCSLGSPAPPPHNKVNLNDIWMENCRKYWVGCQDICAHITLTLSSNLCINNRYHLAS